MTVVDVEWHSRRRTLKLPGFGDHSQVVEEAVVHGAVVGYRLYVVSRQRQR